MDTILWLDKPNEEETKDRLIEELFLGSFAVLIHSVSDNIEVNRSLSDKSFFLLVMSMWVNKPSKERYEFLFEPLG